MISNVVLNKVAIIQRCLKRIKEDYEDTPAHLDDYRRQDAIVLNLQRACEATIDLGMHICSKRKLGLPQASKDAFIFLADNKIISRELCKRMEKMVGFRNIAVHDYQALDLRILQSIIENHLQEFLEFCQCILTLEEKK